MNRFWLARRTVFKPASSYGFNGKYDQDLCLVSHMWQFSLFVLRQFDGCPGSFCVNNIFHFASAMIRKEQYWNPRRLSIATFLLITLHLRLEAHRALESILAKPSSSPSSPNKILTSINVFIDRNRYLTLILLFRREREELSAIPSIRR